MVFCTSTSQYWLRAVGRGNIRIQLSALRAAADTARSADSNGKLQLLKNAIVLNVRPDPEPGDVLILQKVEGTISESHAGGPDGVAIVNR